MLAISQVFWAIRDCGAFAVSGSLVSLAVGVVSGACIVEI